MGRRSRRGTRNAAPMASVIASAATKKSGRRFHSREGIAGAAVVIGLTAGFVAAAGVGVVVVLASRSMDEWRTADQTDPSTPEEGSSNEVRSDEQ